MVLAEDPSGLPGWAQVVLALAILVGLVTKQLVPGWVYSDLREENQALKKERSELIRSALETQPKTISALEASGRVVDEAMAELRVLRRER